MGASQMMLLAAGSGAVPPAWRTIFDWTALTTGLSSGWGGYTLRHVIAQSALGGSGTKLRITCKAHTGGTLTKAYVQIGAASGDSYDFASAPVAVTWDGGSAGYTVGNNTTKLSDEISLSFDGATRLVFSFHWSALSTLYTQLGATGRADSVESYKLGDDATTQNASGYTSPANAAFLNKLELYG